MRIVTDDYQIESKEDQKIVISGILRLPSPSSYEEPFNAIKEKLELSTQFIIDIRQLFFLNSAGINAFARLIIIARNKNIPLQILASQEIPWHQKSIAGSLTKLWDKLEVKLI